jgi:uncharacterized protein YjaZ
MKVNRIVSRTFSRMDYKNRLKNICTERNRKHVAHDSGRSREESEKYSFPVPPRVTLLRKNKEMRSGESIPRQIVWLFMNSFLRDRNKARKFRQAGLPDTDTCFSQLQYITIN